MQLEIFDDQRDEDAMEFQHRFNDIAIHLEYPFIINLTSASKPQSIPYSIRDKAEMRSKALNYPCQWIVLGV